MVAVGFPLGSMASPAAGSWLGLKYQAELPPTEQVLSQIRQLLVMPKIKVPSLHHWQCLVGPLGSSDLDHWGCLAMPVIVISRLYT